MLHILCNTRNAYSNLFSSWTNRPRVLRPVLALYFWQLNWLIERQLGKAGIVGVFYKFPIYQYTWNCGIKRSALESGVIWSFNIQSCILFALLYCIIPLKGAICYQHIYSCRYLFLSIVDVLCSIRLYDWHALWLDYDFFDKKKSCHTRSVIYNTPIHVCLPISSLYHPGTFLYWLHLKESISQPLIQIRKIVQVN